MVDDTRSRVSPQSPDAARVRGLGHWILGVDLVIAVLLLSFCAGVYYLTSQFEEVSPLFAQDVPPEFMPRLLLWTIAALSVLLPFEHLFKPGGRAHFEGSRTIAIKPMAYVTIVLLVAVVLSVKWLGTYLAILLACFALPILWGERRWKLLIPYALVFSTAVMLLFSKMLQVYFEPGIFGIDFR